MDVNENKIYYVFVDTISNFKRKYHSSSSFLNIPICFSGTHRPLWAAYGEYTFLPIQRWIHNLEHGAVVMLYHPCANKNEVQYLKKVVKLCLYRHIITPYNLLSSERVSIKLLKNDKLLCKLVNAIFPE